MKYTKGTIVQGPNSKPLAQFGSHFIVRYKPKTGETIYYDPSYGKSYKASVLYKQFCENIAGYLYRTPDKT